jgi:hypothetical protein
MLHPRFVLLALSCTGFTACGTLVPASDSTPPSVELLYRLEDEPVATPVPTGGLVLEVDPAVTVFLVANAEDSGGVMVVGLDGEAIFICGAAGPMGTLGSLEIHDQASRTAAVGERTESSRMVGTSVKLADVCSSGSPSGFIDIRARAENYHGGETTSPKLTLRAK